MKQDLWALVSCGSVLAAEDPNSWSILFHSPLHIHLLRSSLFDCFNILVSFSTHSTGLYRSAAFCTSSCETVYRIQLKTTVTLAMHFNSSLTFIHLLYTVYSIWFYIHVHVRMSCKLYNCMCVICSCDEDVTQHYFLNSAYNTPRCWNTMTSSGTLINIIRT